MKRVLYINCITLVIDPLIGPLRLIPSWSLAAAPMTSAGKKATPLHAAACLGSTAATDVVATLVDLRADINAADSFKNTPLHHALLQRKYRQFAFIGNRQAIGNI